MSQSVICGLNGNVSISGGRGARLSAWSANLAHELNDCTGFGSNGFRQNKTSLKSMSGQASGFLTKGTTNDQPNWTGLSNCDDGVTVVLTADSGCTFSGIFNISNMRIEEAVAGLGMITFDFISNGTVTETWVTS